MKNRENTAFLGKCQKKNNFETPIKALPMLRFSNAFFSCVAMTFSYRVMAVKKFWGTCVPQESRCKV